METAGFQPRSRGFPGGLLDQPFYGWVVMLYLAEDVRLKRKVALKTLPAAFTNDTERLRRFQQEARAASATLGQTAFEYANRNAVAPCPLHNGASALRLNHHKPEVPRVAAAGNPGL